MKRSSVVDQSAPQQSREQSDFAWFGGVRHGDIAAFERLFRAYAEELVSFAAYRVNGDDDAEDVVHSVFCWLWEHRFTLPQPRSVRAYLFAAVRNRSLNLVRDQRTEAAFRERAARAENIRARPAVAPSPESEFAARDIEHALIAALRELPPRCREVYGLARDHGLSYAEIAEALEISPKTVEIHMSRALALLRVKLAMWITGGTLRD
jgi:RNA polymerase sigma-70 factor (ECF subfamily)